MTKKVERGYKERRLALEEQRLAHEEQRLAHEARGVKCVVRRTIWYQGSFILISCSFKMFQHYE